MKTIMLFLLGALIGSMVYYLVFDYAIKVILWEVVIFTTILLVYVVLVTTKNNK